MSDRDKQRKQDTESNIDNSMYARVNTGQGAGNKFDSPRGTHLGGSTNNPNERNNHSSSLTYTILYYGLGFIMSFLFILMGLWIFKGYFYSEGLNKILPSLLLLIVSLITGFYLSGKISTKLLR